MSYKVNICTFDSNPERLCETVVFKKGCLLHKNIVGGSTCRLCKGGDLILEGEGRRV